MEFVLEALPPVFVIKNEMTLWLSNAGLEQTARLFSPEIVFSAAPIQIARNHLAQASPRALLINSGNANAGTGEQGLQNASLCCQMLADELGCKALEVLPFSTGVIGEQLPLQAFKQALPACVDNLSSDADAWSRASKAIMTTDTVPKLFSRKFDVGGSDVTITGMSKGAGMIRPDMATMLAYIATDAVIEQPVLKQLLTRPHGVSFNRITVDGDTSTNDACTFTGKRNSEDGTYRGQQHRI